MAAINQQFKLTKFAKDLGLKSKELVEILANNGIEAKSTQKALEPSEFDILFDTLTREHQISNIGDYLDGVTYIPSKVKKAAPKKAEKAEAEEKARLEAEAKAKAASLAFCTTSPFKRLSKGMTSPAFRRMEVPPAAESISSVTVTVGFPCSEAYSNARSAVISLVKAAGLMREVSFLR